MGKLTVSMAMFNSYIRHYQRVCPSQASGDELRSLRRDAPSLAERLPETFAKRPASEECYLWACQLHLPRGCLMIFVIFDDF